MPQTTAAFSVLQTKKHCSVKLCAVASPDDEITKQVERAKKLIENTKAKIEAKEKEELEALNDDKKAPKKDVPFFASKKEPNKKKKVTKTQNEEGLITTDGEMMAQMSETEDWEVRSLLDVFENEIEESTDDHFANRDVAASIYGLQRSMQLEDFRKIFNKRNPRIGEQ